jgi:hypothetical protein
LLEHLLQYGFACNLLLFGGLLMHLGGVYIWIL